MMKQQQHSGLSKNLLRRPWQWRPHQKVFPAISNKTQKIILGNKNYKHEENVMSKESLLINGELSDGSKRGDSTHVPKGSMAVYVGPELRRFVIPTSYLSMPEFKVLMDKVEDEFGFEEEGGLQFPCDEHEFGQILIKCGSTTPLNALATT